MEIIEKPSTGGGGGGSSSGGSKGGSSGGKPGAPKVDVHKGDGGTGGQPGVSVPTRKRTSEDVDLTPMFLISILATCVFVIVLLLLIRWTVFEGKR